MGRRSEVVGRARQVLALRHAARSILEPGARERIEWVERSLREELGASLPKKRAAELLGVSLTTLDKWVARGAIPAVRSEGRARSEVDTETVLRLAEERGRLAAGDGSPTLGEAVKRLRERENSERCIAEAATLSRFLTEIAAADESR